MGKTKQTKFLNIFGSLEDQLKSSCNSICYICNKTQRSVSSYGSEGVLCIYANRSALFILTEKGWHECTWWYVCVRVFAQRRDGICSASQIKSIVILFTFYDIVFKTTKQARWQQHKKLEHTLPKD
jgi:hypothetical protein